MANNSYIKPKSSVYSNAQVLLWLQVIQYPEAVSSPDVVQSWLNDRKFPKTMENLTLLSRLHLLAFPFENLNMHYSPKHDMDVTPEGNFQRMVVERKGSYCYGKSGLLLEMLRGLGYRAYASQGRVNENCMNQEKKPSFTPLTHLVLFVQPLEGKNERTTYLVDVGFGGGGLVRPILLEEGATVAGGTSTERHRLSKGPNPKSVLDNPGELSWRLEVQHQKDPSGPPAPWKVLYSFLEIEFFQKDFEQASYYVATHPEGSPFLQQVICVKYFYLDDKKEDLGFTTMYRDHMRQHLGAETKVLDKIDTEEERLKRIREFFGIDMGEEVIEHIKGRKAELGCVA